jgi:hypothetical protein
MMPVPTNVEASAGLGAAVPPIVPPPRISLFDHRVGGSSSWSSVCVQRDQILFRGLGGVQDRRISPRDLRLIAAEGGVSLDGGEIMAWKRLRLKTPREEFTFTLGPANCIGCYLSILAVSPMAVGMPFSRELHLPVALKEFGKKGDRAEATRLLRHEFRRQAWRSGLAGVGFLFALLASAVCFVLSNNRDGISPDALKGGAVVLAVGSVLSGQGAAKWFRGRRVVWLLNEYPQRARLLDDPRLPFHQVFTLAKWQAGR